MLGYRQAVAMKRPAVCMRHDMKKKEFIIVLDRSGSMLSMVSEAAQGLNDFLNGQVGHVQCVRFNQSTFRGRLREVVDLDALRDLHLASACEKPTRVELVIVTDGQENSSQEYTKAAVRAGLEAGKAKGWKVTFLGANMDAAAEAKSLGFAAADAATFSPTGDGVKSAFAGARSRSIGASDWSDKVN